MFVFIATMIVELQDISFFSHHGLYAFEREKGGNFKIDVLIEVPDKNEYTTLQHVANYEDVFAIVAHQMNQPKDFIEEVARLILQELKNRFSNAVQIKVAVTKCAPPIQNMKGHAKVTVEYKK